MASISPHAREVRSVGQRLLRVNWMLIGLIALIGGLGVSTLYSVAGGSFSPWADKHTVRLIVGITIILAMAVVPLRVWLALAYPTYLLALGLLVLVPLLGTEALGAKRWLRLGDFSLQPSEIMKVALVAAIARYYQWLPDEKVSRPIWVLLPALAILAPVMLVLKQPDLGTAVLFATVGFGLMFFAGVNPLYYLAGGASIVAAAPLIWNHLHDYQRRRILTFLDPERDPLGAGYHILQSKIAFGSGGLAGKGYLQGTQGRLNFLPEKQTDFIFTMLAEEGGFIGAVTLVLLYVLLITMLLLMAMAARNAFARLVIAGQAMAVFIYAAVNMAMVMGLVPVVGVPLPLVSYGGTAMMTILIGLGLAMACYVSRHERIRREDVGPLF